MKTLLFAVAMTGMLFTSTAFAQDAMKCDEATMSKMNTALGAMTDPGSTANKEMASQQMAMAKTSMQGKKMDECAAQLGMAQTIMTMKCDDETISKMNTSIGAMTDPSSTANKEMATKSMEMAQASMKDKKSAECMTHMGEAMGAMHKKM